MNALLITTDLMISSTLDGAARAAGVDLNTKAPANLGGSADGAALVAIDLAAPISDIAALVAQLRNAAPAAKIIAFGPHVHVDKLEQARTAGCDAVMSRGEFHSKAHAIMSALTNEV